MMQHVVLADGPSKGVVLTKAATRAADKLQMSSATLAKVIGVSSATVSRLRQGAIALQEGSKPYELSALFVRVYRALDAIMGGDDAVSAKWLESYNTALKAKPIDLIQTVAGLTCVIQYLDSRRAII